MQIIPSDAFSTRDETALAAFLAMCREEAIKAGTSRFASIVVETSFADPLAILENIHQDGFPLWYVERPTDEFALACGESTAYEEFTGEDRFEKAKVFCDDIFSKVIATGDIGRGAAGPTLALAATFESTIDESNSAPAPLTLFLPRWQVMRRGGRHYAVANVEITPVAELTEVAKGIWKAYEKLTTQLSPKQLASLSKDSLSNGRTPSPKLTKLHETPDYEKAVAKVLPKLNAGDFHKVVLARKINYQADKPPSPFSVAHHLRERFPDCHSFCIADSRPGTLVGATPERILRVSSGLVETEALAGTAARGRTAGADARLGHALLGNDKEGREHRLVVDSLLRRMDELGLENPEEGRPRLLRLSNLQHLRTPLRAKLPEHLHALDVLSGLHPTPAMGGSPRKSALPHLRNLENFHRGLYSGVAGWIDHAGDAEFVVPIRCGHLLDKEVTLYAGAGIVQGSDPANEKRETDLKLNAMLEALQVS